MDKNTELSTQGVEISSANEDKIEQNNVTNSVDQSAKAACESSNAERGQNEQKAAPCVAKTGIEALLEKDYEAFSKAFPNISRDLLINDSSFVAYTQNISSTPLIQAYKDYCALCDSIESKVMHSLSASRASVGALSDATSSNEGYFTKEQVKRMSPQEIKRNFEQIRRSQERW